MTAPKKKPRVTFTELEGFIPAGRHGPYALIGLQFNRHIRTRPMGFMAKAALLRRLGKDLIDFADAMGRV